MIATRRRETCWSADSSEDATLFIASLLLSRDVRKRLSSGERRRVPFTGQPARLRSWNRDPELRADRINIFEILFVRFVLRMEFHDPFSRNAPHSIAFY